MCLVLQQLCEFSVVDKPRNPMMYAHVPSTALAISQIIGSIVSFNDGVNISVREVCFRLKDILVVRTATLTWSCWTLQSPHTGLHRWRA